MRGTGGASTTSIERGLGVVPGHLALFTAVCVAAALVVCAARPAGARQVSTNPRAVVATGRVVSQAGQPVADAVVTVAKAHVEVRTSDAGQFELRLPEGDYLIRVTHPDFRPVDVTITARAGQNPIEITLMASLVRYEESIVVRAVRAEDAAPLTMANLARSEIVQRNVGQEIPFLLKELPSLTQYADAGSSTGYSYLSLRGIQQTRLNMTLDGVPLNEPEDSAVYFSDYGDLAASIDSVQVQRGVGTSSVGAASYGGSINFASIDPTETKGLGAEFGMGSFGTRHVALTLNSGRVGPDVQVYARASYRETDGFRDHSGVVQGGLFFGATRRDDRSFLKAFGFVGRERTSLAYLAVEKDVLDRAPRTNPLSPDERDRFTQSFAHVQYTRVLNASTSLAGQIYYQDAGGWYRIWADADHASLYQYGLDWHYGGGMVNLHHVRGPISLTSGAHAYTYRSRHTRDVVDSGRDYENRGSKNQADAFAKLAYDAGRVQLYGDGQVRYASFRYDGDVQLGSVSWTFFNPKAGLRFRLSPGSSVYASLGHMSREPTRSDLLSGEDNATIAHDLRAVQPERVTDLEAGVSWRAGQASVSATAYAMEFRNEIALTGELSEIGLPLRRNVPKSHRRGIELNINWRPAGWVALATTANLSHNRISVWTQFYDVYDSGGNWIDSSSRRFSNVSPLLTPVATVNQRVELMPRRWLSVSASGRWVAESWLDNTNAAGLATPAWFNLDGSVSLSLSRWIPRGEPRLRVQIDNLLDNRHIYPSGYSYQYLLREGSGNDRLFGTPYFYPQAWRSVYVMLDVRM